MVAQETKKGGCPSGLLLSALVDNELPGHLSERVGRHAARCDLCRSRLRDLLETDLLLRIQPLAHTKAGCPNREVLLLYPHLDGERRTRVDAHLVGCDGCLEYLVFVRGVEIPTDLLEVPRAVKDRARGRISARLPDRGAGPAEAPGRSTVRWWWVGLSATAALLLLVLGIVVARTRVSRDRRLALAVGSVENVLGAPQVKGTSTRPAGPVGALPLTVGTLVLTGEKDGARIALRDGTTLFVNHFTGVRLLGPLQKIGQVVDLSRGEIFVEVVKGGSFEVRTPFGELTAVGTAFNVRVNGGSPAADKPPERLEVTVTAGEVALKGEFGDRILKPGTKVVARRNVQPEESPLPTDTGQAPGWTHGLSRPGSVAAGHDSNWLFRGQAALRRSAKLSAGPGVLASYLEELASQTGFPITLDPGAGPASADPFEPPGREGEAGALLEGLLGPRRLSYFLTREGLVVYRKGAILTTTSTLALLLPLGGPEQKVQAYLEAAVGTLYEERSLGVRGILLALDQVRALEDEDPARRRWALVVLATPPLAQSAETVPYLSRALFDGEADIRRRAVEGLNRIGGAEALRAIRSGLRDTSPLVREACVLSLVSWADSGALPEIRALLDDPDEKVRSAAGGALQRLPP